MSGYTAATVTLTTGSTNYQLITLLRAIAADTPGEARSVLIEADSANTAGSKVSIGDASLSGTRYGFQLGPGDARLYSDSDALVRLGAIYARGSGDGLKLNIEVMR